MKKKFCELVLGDYIIIKFSTLRNARNIPEFNNEILICQISGITRGQDFICFIVECENGKTYRISLQKDIQYYTVDTITEIDESRPELEERKIAAIFSCIEFVTEHFFTNIEFLKEKIRTEEDAFIRFKNYYYTFDPPF